MKEPAKPLGALGPRRSRRGPLVPGEAAGGPWSPAKPQGAPGPRRSRRGPLVPGEAAGGPWPPAKPLGALGPVAIQYRYSIDTVYLFIYLFIY